MRRIDADSTTLMNQAPMTADTYMIEAVKRIDAQFGAGYAKANPGLVGQFIVASSIDFATSIIAGAIEEVASCL